MPVIQSRIKYFDFYDSKHEIDSKGYKVESSAHEFDMCTFGDDTKKWGLRIDLVVYKQSDDLEATETVYVYHDTEHLDGLSVIQKAVDDCIRELEEVKASNG